MKPERHVLAPLILMILFIVCAFTLPRVAVGSESGLAAAGTAAITLLFFILLASLAALYAFAAALRFRRVLAKRFYYAGLLPLPGLLVAMTGFWFFVSHQSKAPPSNGFPPRPTTPSADAIAIPQSESPSP